MSFTSEKKALLIEWGVLWIFVIVRALLIWFYMAACRISFHCGHGIELNAKLFILSGIINFYCNFAVEMRIIEECGSTNAALDREAAHGDALLALAQTAGRGQRGNTWESAPGQNITMSIMLRPEQLPVNRQFELSEAVALGVADLLDKTGIEGVKVKWPNDIYVGDRKICGILIENTLGGAMIVRSIAGVGLNVNQTEFVGSAPNPVSMKQLTGKDYDICELAEQLVGCVMARLECGAANNHADYRDRLWRGTGEWTWQTADGEAFTAAVVEVLADGRLLLTGRPEPFGFKEVKPMGFAN